MAKKKLRRLSKNVAKKKRGRPRKSSASRSTGVNKSQEIRDFLAANPAARPGAVVDALSRRGIKVSSAFVSTIKARKKPGRRSTRRGSRNDTMVNVSDLLQAREFAKRVGGVDRALAALNTLGKLGV